MGYTWGIMSKHVKQERLWIAASLHQRIKAMKRRTGKPMLQIANELIRRGLADSREDKRKVRRDVRGDKG